MEAIQRRKGEVSEMHKEKEMTTTKPQSTTEERPVRCAACGEQMCYAGNARHEPEMVMTVDFRNGDYSHRNDGGVVFHVHERCFEGFQLRFSGSTATPASAAPVVESPILAFDAWLERWVADNGRKLTQDEYGIAYAAFIAAHPGEGPKAQVMAAPVVEKCMAEPKSDTELICVNCGREVVMSEYGPPINDICWSHTHNGVVWCNWPTTTAPVAASANAAWINATADLVTDERLAALVDAKVLPAAAPLERDDIPEHITMEIVSPVTSARAVAEECTVTSVNQSALTEEESQCVIGAIPLQALPPKCSECDSQMELQHVCEKCGWRISAGAKG